MKQNFFFSFTLKLCRYEILLKNIHQRLKYLIPILCDNIWKIRERKFNKTKLEQDL